MQLTIVLKGDASGLTGTVRVSNAELAKLNTNLNATGGAGARAAGGLNQTEAAARRANGGVRELASGFNTLRGTLATLGITLVARELMQAGLAMSRFEVGLAAALGSQQAGGAAMAFLRMEAERLGLYLPTLVQGFTGLAAATRGTALEGEATRKIFSAVAEAGRAMNLTNEQISGTLNALQQMAGKGTISMEELLQQLGERLPGAMQVAARSMNMTVGELVKMVSEGELASDVFLPKFAAELSKAAAAGVVFAQNSPAAEFARLRTALFELGASVSAGGLMEALADAAKSLTASLKSLVDSGAASALGSALGALVRSIDALIVAIGVLYGARGIMALSKAFQQQVATMAATSAAYEMMGMRVNTLASAKMNLLRQGSALFVAMGGWPAVIAAAAFALYSLWESFDEGARLAEDAVTSLDRIITSSKQGLKELEAATRGVSEANIGSIVSYEDATIALGVYQDRLKGLQAAEESWLGTLAKAYSGTSLGAAFLAALALQSNQAEDAVESLTRAQQDALESSLQYAAAQDRNARANGEQSAALQQVIGDYARSGLTFEQVYATLEKLELEVEYLNSLWLEAPSAVTAASKGYSRATMELVSAMRQEIDTAGKTRAEMMAMNVQRQIATLQAEMYAVATDEEREAMKREVTVLQELLPAYQNAATESQRGARAHRENTDALRDYTPAAEDAAFATESLYTHLQDITDVTGEVEGMIRDLTRTLADDATRAQMDYEDNLARILALEMQWMSLGPMSAEQIARLNQARSLALQSYERDLEGVVERSRENLNRLVDAVSGDLADAFGQFAVDAMSDFDNLDEAFDNLGDALVDMAKRAVAQMIAEFMKLEILNPLLNRVFGTNLDTGGSALGQLAARFGGGGNGFGSFGNAAGWQGAHAGLGPGGFGPPSQLSGTFGSSIFGSSAGQWFGGNRGMALAGNAMGFLGGAYGVFNNFRNGPGGLAGGASGAMSGAMAGTAIMPGIGTVVGAIISGLAGIFGGRGDPRFRVADRENDARSSSRLDDVIGAARDNMESGSATALVNGIRDFDNAIADFLNNDELARVRDVLDNWTIDVSGSAATVENILGQRFSAILATFNEDVQAYVNAADTLEERTQRLAEALSWDDQIDGLLEGFRRENRLAGMDEMARQTFLVNEQFDALAEQMRNMHATEAQLAELETFRTQALGRLVIVEATAVENTTDLADAEAELIAARSEAIANLEQMMFGIRRENAGLSEFAQAMLDAGDWRADAIRSANEHARAAGLAGAREGDLADIELRAAQMRAQAIAVARSGLQDALVGAGYIDAPDTLDSLNARIAELQGGATNAASAFTAAGDAIGQAVDTMRDQMQLLLGDLSPFNDNRKLEIAREGLQAGSVSQEQFLQIARRLFGSTDSYLREFEFAQQFPNRAQEMGGGGFNVSGSSTFSAGGGDGRTLDQLIEARDALLAANRVTNAQDIARRMAELSAASGETFDELASSMGFSLDRLAADLSFTDTQLRDYLQSISDTFTEDQFMLGANAITAAIQFSTDAIVAAITGRDFMGIKPGSDFRYKPDVPNAADYYKPDDSGAPGKPVPFVDDGGKRLSIGPAVSVAGGSNDVATLRAEIAAMRAALDTSNALLATIMGNTGSTAESGAATVSGLADVAGGLRSVARATEDNGAKQGMMP